MQRFRLYILLFLGFWTGCEVSASGAGQDSLGVAKAENQVWLVKDGRATSVLILPEGTDDMLQELAAYFIHAVERSTGARIPLLREGDEGELPETTARVFLGPTRHAAGLGLSIGKLPEESYRIVASEGFITILGRDNAVKGAAGSQPTRWALNRILEDGLGVRWLWPGDLGTYVPAHASLSVATGETSYQPRLVLRNLRLNFRHFHITASSELDARLKAEGIDWVENHQAGRRGDIRFGHAFGDWWQKYGSEHPDYFAETPPGIEQPVPKADRVKLRLSNPAVIEQIAKEYQEAGAPEYYNVCPNDGSGFDVSDSTRAWDIPSNQTVEDIWNAKANLTARYVKFWNLLFERLRQINPKVTLVSYAYSSYRYPPPPERPLTAKMVLGIVVGYRGEENYVIWRAWAQTGSGLFLRPNWWHYGANAPWLPTNDMANFLKFASGKGMVGLDMDSLLGFWSTQGFGYYLVARLMTRPELSQDDILSEYTSAFGEAAPIIRKYLEYWESVTTAYSESSPNLAGWKNVEEKKEALVRRKVDRNSYHGILFNMPELYSDDVLAPAYELLDKGTSLLKDRNSDAARRIAFLRGGLDEVRATRDLVALSLQVKKKNPAAVGRQFRKEFQAQAGLVSDLREKLSAEHVLWGGQANWYEDSRQFPIRPANVSLPELKWDGME